MFTGREWFPERGIYDYRNRFYQPELGRFLQTDPKGFDAGDMNLFRYCADDPVDRTDPDGLTDVAISAELLQKIWEASNNSMAEAVRQKDGFGRGQVVEHRVGAQGSAAGGLVLQKSFEKGRIVYKPREQYQKYHKGEPYRIVMQEGPYKADRGHKIDAIGHGHQDVTGRPRGEAKFSPEDKDMARGAPGVAAIPIGRIDESSKRVLHVLVPQVEHTEPQERTISASQFEETQQRRGQ